jgi:putative phosphoribosyl transferase
VIFKDRAEAGTVLAKKLEKYRQSQDAQVVGLARGGIVTAAAVAKALQLPLDVICIRKIGAPHNPELALGAIGSNGQVFLNEDLIGYLNVSSLFLQEEMQRQKTVAKAREDAYHKVCPEKDVTGKTVILVDDGLATGATMQAAVAKMRKDGAARIIAAIPVAAPDSLEQIKLVCDEAVCIDAPPFFQAVGQFYDDFSQVEDNEVISILGLRTNAKY